MTIKTKADLLTTMRTYGACDDATEYVLAAPETATAREIWLGCDRAEWLVWFGSRHRPTAMRAFAFACADRAVRVYAADAYTVADTAAYAAAADVAATAAARSATATAAAYAAAYTYAAAYPYVADDERRTQLTELHSLADAILIG